MKRKILSIILSFTMVFSTTGLIFADTEVDNQSELTKVEKEIEKAPSQEKVEKEEPKKEEVKEESKTEEEPKVEEESKVEEKATEEAQKANSKKEIKKRGSAKDDEVETEKVTVQFQVIKPTGNWANAGGSSSVIIKKGEIGSKTFTIKDEDKRDVSINGTSTIYHYLETWGNGKYNASSGKIKLDRATVFNEYKKDGEAEVTVYIKADYEILKNYYLDINYIDNIANGSGGDSHYNNKTDYTHTFKTPADIPSNYEFLYWENKETGKKYDTGDTFTVKANTIDEDTTINIYAVYNYQPQIKAIYHYKVNHANKIKDIGIYSKPIDIYEMAPVSEKWFYEDDNTPIEQGTKINLPEKFEKIVNPVDDKDKVVVTNLYAHYYTITWVNDDETVLEKDLDVSYGTIPSYDGETPTKEKTAQYTYTFIGWTPGIAEVTKDMTYTATYDKTVNTYTVTWIDYTSEVLEKDLEVPYGTMPSYDSATPKRSATSKYKYEFIGWTPEIVEVTGDAIYKAVYRIIPIPAPPQPDPDKPDNPDKPDKPDQPKTVNKTETKTAPTENNNTKWILGKNAGMGDDIEYTPFSDVDVPLMAPKQEGSWALINLLAALATIIIGFILVIMYIINEVREEENYDDNEEDEEKEYKNRGIRRIIAVIIGIISMIIFFLTENTNLPMEWVDKWTILMIIILIINIIMAFLSRRVEKEEEEEEK